MGAQAHQPITIERGEGGAGLGVEAELRRGPLRVSEIALAEGRVGLEQKEALVEPVSAAGREGVVEE